MNELLNSKKFKIAAGIVGALILALVIFGAGVSVGIHKARFSYRFGENYERNFMGPRPIGPMGRPMEIFRDMKGEGFRNSHGVIGEIVSISENNLVIKDPRGEENTVSIHDNTIIKNRRDDIKITDLKKGEKIAVLGKPDDNGIISADLIRVFEPIQTSQ